MRWIDDVRQRAATVRAGGALPWPAVALTGLVAALLAPAVWVWRTAVRLFAPARPPSAPVPPTLLGRRWDLSGAALVSCTHLPDGRLEFHLAGPMTAYRHTSDGLYAWSTDAVGLRLALANDRVVGRIERLVQTGEPIDGFVLQQTTSDGREAIIGLQLTSRISGAVLPS